ncbi:MAG: transposase [Anaerolineales bacterium]|nr:MAG: transposase [Anaerolineales bacterium]
MSQRPRAVIPNATYFITSVTHGRRRWFAKQEFAEIVVQQWKHYEKAYQFRLNTYSVLPDHYHVVLDVGTSKTIAQILHAVHSYTATLISKKLGRATKIHVWEGNAWDEVIRDEDMYWQKVAYTLLNAWREGLVSEPLEPYPFSDLSEWLGREGEQFLFDLFSRYKSWGE